MPEAIDRMGKLRHNRRVDFGAGIENEGVHHRLDAASKLFEHHVLVLHLGAEARGLEQAIAIPHPRILISHVRRGAIQEPRLHKSGIVQRFRSDRGLVRIDQAVVLGMEDGMNGRERNVFIAASVAGDKMRVQHLVVVGKFVLPASRYPWCDVIGCKKIGCVDGAVTIDVSEGVNTSVVDAIAIRIDVRIRDLLD